IHTQQRFVTDLDRRDHMLRRPSLSKGLQAFSRQHAVPRSPPWRNRSGGEPMSSSTPFLPPVLQVVHEMVTNKAVPALDGDQMATLCSYLFAIPDRALRIQIAEIAYRNYDDPQALDVFLACTMPLAKQMAERKAYRIFGLPSDWQLEC